MVVFDGPGCGVVVRRQEVVKRCGVRPDQARDLQSLAGDQVSDWPMASSVQSEAGQGGREQ